MNKKQALQIVETVCAGHLCNRQDRIAIEQALNVLRGLVIDKPEETEKEGDAESPV